MTLYHGTVESYLPSILKEGLKCVENNRFRVFLSTSFGFRRPLTETEAGGYVYLTPDYRLARDFAKLREEYLKEVPGKIIRIEGFAPFLKMENAPILETKPVLLAIYLPSTIHVEADPRMPSEAVRIKGIIPPSYIKRVERREQWL